MAGHQTHYEVLGVARDASHEVIRQAWKRLSLVHHPDKNAHKSPHERRYHNQTQVLVNAAWECIQDAHKRDDYDHELDEDSRSPRGTKHSHFDPASYDSKDDSDFEPEKGPGRYNHDMNYRGSCPNKKAKTEATDAPLPLTNIETRATRAARLQKEAAANPTKASPQEPTQSNRSSTETCRVGEEIPVKPKQTIKLRFWKTPQPRGNNTGEVSGNKNKSLAPGNRNPNLSATVMRHTLAIAPTSAPNSKFQAPGLFNDSTISSSGKPASQDQTAAAPEAVSGPKFETFEKNPRAQFATKQNISGGKMQERDPVEPSRQSTRERKQTMRAVESKQQARKGVSKVSKTTKAKISATKDESPITTTVLEESSAPQQRIPLAHINANLPTKRKRARVEIRAEDAEQNLRKRRRTVEPERAEAETPETIFPSGFVLRIRSGRLSCSSRSRKS